MGGGNKFFSSLCLQWRVEFGTGGWNLTPFRVSTNTYIRNCRSRHPFAMKLIANERGWNFCAGSGLKYLIIISFTLRALVIFNFSQTWMILLLSSERRESWKCKRVFMSRMVKRYVSRELLILLLKGIKNHYPHWNSILFRLRLFVS